MLTAAILPLCMVAIDRPNIVVIFSDDHARSAISAYGSQLIQTPRIDSLAKEGTRFTRHYTANPICAPSRASLLTGKHSHMNGHRDNVTQFDGSQETLPKLLQQAGYETGVVGKWHLASQPTGFDYWEVLPGQGSYYNPDFLTPSGTKRVAGYCTEVITDKAKAWISKSRSKPFFLLVGHKAPHRSWEPGPQDLRLFEGRTIPEPATLRTTYASLASGATKAGMRIDANLRPKEDLMVGYGVARMSADQRAVWDRAYADQDRRYLDSVAKPGDLLGINYQRYAKQYLRTIAAVDRSVGELLDTLKANGIDRNTVVVYASDQGFFVGENAWYDKRWFFEPSAGTPLIVRQAGSRAPRTVDAVTSNVDVAPTLLELAGVPVPSAMQGRPLVDGLSGKPLAAIPAYGHFYESDDGEHNVPKYVSIVDARYKLICYYELGEWEMFDLKDDPNEAKNCWADPASKGLRRALMRRLLQRQIELKEDESILRRMRELIALAS